MYHKPVSRLLESPLLMVGPNLYLSGEDPGLIFQAKELPEEDTWKVDNYSPWDD